MPVSTALERKKAIFCLFSACFKISIVLGKLKAPPFEKIPAERRDFFIVFRRSFGHQASGRFIPYKNPRLIKAGI